MHIQQSHEMVGIYNRLGWLKQSQWLYFTLSRFGIRHCISRCRKVCKPYWHATIPRRIADLVRAYLNIYSYLRKFKYNFTHIHAHSPTRSFSYNYSHTHTHPHMFTHTHANTFIHIYRHAHKHSGTHTNIAFTIIDSLGGNQ